VVGLYVSGEWLGLDVEGRWRIAEWVWCWALRRALDAARRGHGPYGSRVVLSERGGAGWGIVGLAEGGLGGLCCEHCVDGGWLYGVVWRIRGSDAEVGCQLVLGFQGV
jgi:hypothetical protein